MTPIQVDIKHLRDFVANVSAANGPGFACTQMWGGTGAPPLIVEIFSIAPGMQTPAECGTDGVGLIICWRGRGTVSLALRKSDDSGWEAPIVDAPGSNGIHITPGDTLILPKRSAHRFTALAEERKSVQHPFPRANQDPQVWPVEKLVLLRVSIPGKGNLHRMAEPFPDGFSQVLSGDALTSYKRRIADYLGFELDPKLICVRSKIWGKEGLVAGGATDFAKPMFHFTAYTFVPRQENPEHHHPKSVELVLCWQGRAKMTVRPRRDEDNVGDIRWEDAREERELSEGDLVLVPEGALHWYGVSGEEDLVLLALQTPHPVLHVLEDDSSGSSLDGEKEGPPSTGSFDTKISASSLRSLR
ncbi:Cupin domain protein [Caballeronia calidae]|uniref:Cupin domain protein n=1 Tax=Caballeronia calidae TaxID=1777139 RepID=A0A158EJW4_9BURK|nr:cupin domain-containing protein [Caballeronia calidae]SAL07020.1 Cupin domain protein [Caballeronia calidae]